MNWKGTKGEWYVGDIKSQRECGVYCNTIIDRAKEHGQERGEDGELCQCWVDVYNGKIQTEEEARANAKLIADAGNTIQICDRLPSQILEERNELFGALLDLQAAQNGPPLEREKDYWQTCMDRATKIINKIENGK